MPDRAECQSAWKSPSNDSIPATKLTSTAATTRSRWNRFAIIWDIAVDPPFRRRGIGRRLIEQATAWARARDLPGVMLETQHINVAACRLYESCGFILEGFDACLYRGAMPGTREIALFWYLLF
jgi:streptothricin acetyltransferase